MTKAVELHPAYVWDCEKCGVENFCRSVVREFDPEEDAKLREEYGLDEHCMGDWVSMPESVTCKACGAEFATEHHLDWDAE